MFHVKRLFLAPHRFKEPKWQNTLGFWRYEILEMNRLFRSEDAQEQTKDATLLYVAGNYHRKFGEYIPVVILPNMRVLPADSIMEIIGIASLKNREREIYNCVNTYAKDLAKQMKLEFIDLVHQRNLF